LDYLFPLTATSRGGSTRVLNTIAEVVEFRKAHHVGLYWTTYPSYWRDLRSERRRPDPAHMVRWDPVDYEWIVRDDRGRPANVWEFEDVSRKPYDYYKAVRHAEALGLPIPGRGKRRRWHRRSSSDKGRNGTYNRDKGLKLYEDALIHRGLLDEF
jgi:hypothetical protein